MASFRVTGPDGAVYRVTAPDDASEADVMQRVRAQVQQEAIAAERDKMMRENVASMSPAERVAANWSAGYGNLVQGLQQVLSKTGLVSPVSDEDIREKRERDRYLAEGTTGGKALQVTSEVLPSMAIPGAAYGRAVQLLPTVAKAGPITQLLAAGGAGGAVSSALSPVTSDESRGMNMAAGGLLGVAIPGAGVTAPTVVRGARKLLTDAGARARALETIAERLRDPNLTALALERAPRPTLRGRPTELPTTAAQASGDAGLAQAEAFSRSRASTQPGWADFDAAQNAARYEHLTELTPSELRLERLRTVREGRTAPLRQQGLAEATARGNVGQGALGAANDLLAGASGANPAVKSVASYVSRELGPEASGAVTSERLYAVRKVLAAKLGGRSMPGDGLAAATKEARAETMNLIRAIDDDLAGDVREGSTWDDYLREYAARSRPVTSAEAMQTTLAKMAEKPYLGTTPHVTATGLRTASRGTEGRYGDKLTETARGDLDAFMETLRGAEAAGRTRKLSATMGGGSITNSDQQLANVVGSFIESLPGVGGYAKRISDFNREAVERHLAELLQSPTMLGEALRNLGPTQRQQFVELAYQEGLRASALAAGQ